MRDLPELDERTFYEFIAGSGPNVLFLFVHEMQPFNAALPERLQEAFGGHAVPLAGLSLGKLLLARSPILRVLQQAASELRTARRFGVLPGYYLVSEGKLLAWQSGLPAGAERTWLMGGAMLGAVWHATLGSGAFVAQLLRAMFDEASARRMAASFRHSFERRRQPPPEGERRRVAQRDLRAAYRLLGILPSAGDHEVERAWRKMRAAHHPDLARGDAAELERRTRMSLEIDRARELIRAHRAARAARQPT